MMVREKLKKKSQRELPMSNTFIFKVLFLCDSGSIHTNDNNNVATAVAVLEK